MIRQAHSLRQSTTLLVASGCICLLFACDQPGPSTTAPANAPTPPATTPAPAPVSAAGEVRPVDRSSPQAAADSLLQALRRHDAAALAQVLAPGKDGTSDQRAAQTLEGKGKLQNLAAAVDQGTRLAPGRQATVDPQDGREAVKLALDLTDDAGKVFKDAAALELFKFEDGWRVDDFDRWGGNWPRHVR